MTSLTVFTPVWLTPPAVSVTLVAGYSMLLLAIAWGFDLMSKRVSKRASEWRTEGFVYHEDHDAWLCPEDQWLWPKSFDPENRVMRYRANPTICNACPVKDTCTVSDQGREVTREYDPWPHSEAGRFHRGIACMIAVLAVVMPLLMLLGAHSAMDVGVLVLTALIGIALGFPLAQHLWRTPSGFPDYVSQDKVYRPVIAADPYQTSWGTKGTK